MSELSLTAINTGSFALDGGAMFGRIPKALWEKQYPADALNRIPLALRCLLVKWEEAGKQKSLLIDVGIGEKWSAKSRDIYGIRNNPDVWSEPGQKPEEITDVLITHLHFDHVGGSTQRAADGSIVPAFPNARFYAGREHWDYAHRPSLLDRVSYMPENYDPLKELGRMHLLEPPSSPWPHIRLLQFFGHTRGIMLPLINAGDKIILFAGDLIPTRCHIRLPWIMGYDLSCEETLGEKSFVLDLAADNHWGIFLEHDIDTELVTVKRDKADFLVERAWKLEEFLKS